MFLCAALAVAEEETIHVGPQPDGSIVVPTHQVLRPAGFQIEFFGRPTNVALHPDPERGLLAVKNFRDVMLIELEQQVIRHSVPLRGGATWTGLVWNRAGDRLYVTNTENQLVGFSLENRTLIQQGVVTFPGPGGEGRSGPAGIALSPDGATAYVCLSRNNSVAVVNLETKEFTQIPVGVAPFEVLVSGDRLFVSNWGGRHPGPEDASAESSGTMVEVDERGIGKSGTVSVVDLAAGRETKQIDTGLHPSGMALSRSEKRLFVACPNSDVISVVDTDKLEVVETISARPHADFPFGSAPNAVALSRDGATLYVANGGNNAIAVVALSARAGERPDGPENSRIVGQIPTGWYPGDVKLGDRGRLLLVANVKGVGSRTPRTSNQGAFNTHDHRGSVSLIPVPDATRLAEYTTIVDNNNRIGYARRSLLSAESDKPPVPVPENHGEPSVFKHVVYIIKENRTYDQVLGDMPEGNGDPSLVHFGEEVTPNHHALARQFTLFDNFYCSGILSADGHQWTNEAYVTSYLERSFGGWVRSYPYPGGDALAYAGSGFLWDNALAHGLSFRTYGEFVFATIRPRNATFLDCYRDFIDGTGRISITGRASVASLEPYTCTTTIGFPSIVPDVYRANEFIKELAEFEKNGRFPNLCMMLLPNDHTAGTRPGYPTPRAAVADNDLALGRVVEAISKSRYWKETCIFVVQDDPQAGVDHVDGHRTVAFVISPYTKRKFVDSTHYTQTGMVKTIELILGLPPMNQFDLSATAMRNCFTDQADYTPYTALPNNIPLDQMNPGLSQLDGPQRYWAEKSLELPLDDVDLADEDTLNRILWHSVKGYDVPYPRLAWMDKYPELRK
ncbi:bifunctional YncE family protein/alkaline phosphatase family protein [bacterium]|nr:bifunctional YncE family protein/alkaline phosphatase family protein [bacterium]